MRLAVLAVGVLVAGPTARAEQPDAAAGVPDVADDPLVLLNATSRTGGLGQVDRLRRALALRDLRRSRDSAEVAQLGEPGWTEEAA